MLAPPVSATNDKVFFRSGDTRIRYLTPSGQTADVTTVPGGSKVISFFSVSPDDKRIAVLVENFSSSTTISLQLYVEDLVGGGNHAVIYATTITQGKAGTTLWPLGWHGRSLVLAVVAACTFEQVPYPFAWHVVDSGTAVRQLSIGSSTCLPGWWPSRAGLTCFDYTRSQINVYDWSGRVTATVKASSASQPALSPNGNSISVVEGGGLGITSPLTIVLPTAGGVPVTIPGPMACLWIDDTAMLAPGAIIRYPSDTIVDEPGGECAGRFPGGF